MLLLIVRRTSNTLLEAEYICTKYSTYKRKQDKPFLY